MPIHRSCCLECRCHLDGPQSWGPHVDQFAISALLFFESLLRDAIAQRREADASASGFAILIEPIQDLAWALMRPVPGSSLRVLHFMQTQQFRVPPGLNYPNRVFELARFGINWLAPLPLGSDRQPDTVRFKVQHADLGSRKRAAVLDEDAGLTRPRGPERIQPENCNMEPARSRRTGILQVKEFSTGKGIKPPTEARFLQVKEKRQALWPVGDN